jgi:sentrin-specific protease 1
VSDYDSSNIFGGLYTMVLMPLHLGHHWVSVQFLLAGRTITYYDSLFQVKDVRQMAKTQRESYELKAAEIQARGAILIRWLNDHHTQYMGAPLHENWTFQIATNMPQQSNGSDCGVFTCYALDRLSQSLPFDFGQANMPLLRKR